MRKSARSACSCPWSSAIRRAAPRLGEHSDEVLREAGYSDAEIGVLRQKGIV